MSNIYLKFFIDTFSKLRFSGFKKFITRSDFGEPQGTHSNASLNFKTLVMQPKNQRSGSRTMCGFSIIVILKGVMTFQSQRLHGFC